MQFGAEGRGDRGKAVGVPKSLRTLHFLLVSSLKDPDSDIHPGEISMVKQKLLGSEVIIFCTLFSISRSFKELASTHWTPGGFVHRHILKCLHLSELSWNRFCV